MSVQPLITPRAPPQQKAYDRSLFLDAPARVNAVAATACDQHQIDVGQDEDRVAFLTRLRFTPTAKRMVFAPFFRTFYMSDVSDIFAQPDKESPMVRILTVIGARPQVIKAAVVHQRLPVGRT
ncbi:hypothetical protein [uncultured Tateyamaria sp.]|uniref:hypothetical protein n=1 Tax=uncultured Tateyamaria sp. TaxID=455651 RepID=UPI00261F340A|nr:hypothetical protein [uncultured Tateyamaria sp.]